MDDAVPALESTIQRDLGPRPTGLDMEDEAEAAGVQRAAPEAVVGRELEPAVRRLDGRSGGRSSESPQTSRFCTLRASDLMKSLRGADLLAHQHREDLVGGRGILAVDPQQGPRLGVHRRLPELVGVHLAEALEPLDGQVLDVEFLDDPVAFLLGLGVPA